MSLKNILNWAESNSHINTPDLQDWFNSSINLLTPPFRTLFVLKKHFLKKEEKKWLLWVIIASKKFQYVGVLAWHGMFTVNFSKWLHYIWRLAPILKKWINEPLLNKQVSFLWYSIMILMYIWFNTYPSPKGISPPTTSPLEWLESNKPPPICKRL